MSLEAASKETGVVSAIEDKTPRTPPNGGAKAWLSVLAAFILFFVSWGPATGYGAYQDYYQRNLLASYSSSTIAWIGTVNATLLVATGVLAGPLFDQGYVRHLMVLGAILLVLGQMMLSLSDQYYQIILSQGICSGIGAGLVYVPSIALVNTQFTTKRALAMGLVTSGASLGMVPFRQTSISTVYIVRF
jgi:MFS family permease